MSTRVVIEIFTTFLNSFILGILYATERIYEREHGSFLKFIYSISNYKISFYKLMLETHCTARKNNVARPMTILIANKIIAQIVAKIQACASNLAVCFLLVCRITSSCTNDRRK